MPVFFIELEVIPTEHNTQAVLIEGAYARCWILEDFPATAYLKVSYYVRRYEWDILGSTEPLEVAEEDFANDDVGLEQLKKARKDAIAVFFRAWPRDGKTTIEPTTLPRSSSFDLNGYVRLQKKFANSARCLHFESPGECTDPAKAHSLQRNGLLRLISQDSHVYVPSTNISTIRKNVGKFTLERRGIAKASTFAGFCAKHDAELFRPIDTVALTPTSQQVALSAYRTLCREFFVKENAANVISEQLKSDGHDRATRELFEAYRIGTSIGFKNLQRHKAEFDEMLRSGSYQDMEYTLFVFKQPPLFAFSAVFYPDFDFLGHQLQDLANHTANFELMTICSVGMEDGWGLLFSWHRTSSLACTEFLGSLAAAMREGRNAEAALLQMVVAFCENLAVAPRWWEALAEQQRAQFCVALSTGTSLLATDAPARLTVDLKVDTGWKIESVWEPRATG